MGNSWLVRHFGWMAVVFSTTSTILVGIYVGLLTSFIVTNQAKGQNIAIPEALKAHGYWNILPILGLVTIAFYAFLSYRVTATISAREKLKTIVLIENILSIIVDLVIGKKRNITVRALVTIYEPDTKLRWTICGVNIQPDPERGLGVPADFGAAGEAFTNGTVVWRDISADHYSRYPPELKGRIWRDLRSILAVPLRRTDEKIIGTLNFDSSAPLNITKFDDREIHALVSRVADIIGPLYSGELKRMH